MLPMLYACNALKQCLHSQMKNENHMTMTYRYRVYTVYIVHTYRYPSHSFHSHQPQLKLIDKSSFAANIAYSCLFLSPKLWAQLGDIILRREESQKNTKINEKKWIRKVVGCTRTLALHEIVHICNFQWKWSHIDAVAGAEWAIKILIPASGWSGFATRRKLWLKYTRTQMKMKWAHRRVY